VQAACIHHFFLEKIRRRVQKLWRPSCTRSRRACCALLCVWQTYTVYQWSV